MLFFFSNYYYYHFDDDIYLQENAETLLSSVQSHSLPGSRPASGIPPSTVLGMEPGRPAPVGELPDITALYKRMQVVSI